VIEWQIRKRIGRERMPENTFIQEYKEIIEKAIRASEKAKREGFLALKDLIEPLSSSQNEGSTFYEGKVIKKDIFEFGLQLIADGENKRFIEKILTNLVNLETDNKIKLLKTIEKDAILAIQEGMETRLLKLLLDSYVDIIAEAIAELGLNINPRHILHFMDQEYPPIFALILASLDEYKAALILQNLPPLLRNDVAYRITKIDKISSEQLRRIIEGLKTAIRVLERMQSSQDSEGDIAIAGGVECIIEIFDLVDRSVEKQIIQTLEEKDPELAEEIKDRMFVFEDIVMFDDRSIQRVLRDVDFNELARALKSVDTVVQDKVFRNISKDAASILKEDMENMGPVRLREVEEAQKNIVSIIRRLEENGEIYIAPRPGEDVMVI
jgi:flagellar motor switch protein FliG